MNIQNYSEKIGRNDQCPCDSGKKYKKCCINSDADTNRYVIEFNPLIEDYCYSLLDEFNQENYDLEKIKNHAKELYNLHPNNCIVNFLLGICHSREEKSNEAISYFEKAIKINPNFPEAYLNLAYIYEYKERILEAVHHYEKVIKIAGKNSPLGIKVQSEIDKLEDRIKELHDVSLDNYLFFQKIFYIGVQNLVLKKYEDSIYLFNYVTEFLPKHYLSYGNLAIAHCALGENKLALEHIEKALSIIPNHEYYLINKSKILKLNEGEKVDLLDDIK